MTLYNRHKNGEPVFQLGMLTYVHTDLFQFSYGEVEGESWRIWEFYLGSWVLCLEPGRKRRSSGGSDA